MSVDVGVAALADMCYLEAVCSVAKSGVLTANDAMGPMNFDTACAVAESDRGRAATYVGEALGCMLCCLAISDLSVVVCVVVYVKDDVEKYDEFMVVEVVDVVVVECSDEATCCSVCGAMSFMAMSVGGNCCPMSLDLGLTTCYATGPSGD